MFLTATFWTSCLNVTFICLSRTKDSMQIASILLKIAGIFQYQLLDGLTPSMGFISAGVTAALYLPERSQGIIDREPLVRGHF